MELKEAIKICQIAIPKDLVKGKGMWHGYEDDELLVLKQAIDTVLAELDRLQDENKEMKDVIEIMQDEIKHIPSIVSETM